MLGDERNLTSLRNDRHQMRWPWSGPRSDRCAWSVEAKAVRANRRHSGLCCKDGLDAPNSHRRALHPW